MTVGIAPSVNTEALSAWLFVPVTRVLPTEAEKRRVVIDGLKELIAAAYEPDDDQRIALITRAFDQLDTSVQAYPDENDSRHWHVHLFSPKVSPYPLFVGVLDSASEPAS